MEVVFKKTYTTKRGTIELKIYVNDTSFNVVAVDEGKNTCFTGVCGDKDKAVKLMKRFEKRLKNVITTKIVINEIGL